MNSRMTFYVTSVLALSLVLFLAGLYSGVNKTLPYRIFASIQADVTTVVNEAPNLTGTKPKNWVMEKRYAGNGVTVNQTGDADTDWVFLQGFFDDGLQLRLIKRNGELIARWPVSFRALADRITHARNLPATDWNAGFHGAVILPDGSVVFNISHLGLFRFNRCGSIQWHVDEPTHHAVEVTADGHYWVPSANAVEQLAQGDLALFHPPYAADTLLKVSPEGKTVEEISLIDVFVNSDQLGLLTLTGGITPGTFRAYRPDFNRELFHLNDVEALPATLAAAYPMFETGDLLVSLRNRNLIMVLDAKTRRIKWWHVGPWIRQHDPDWGRDGSITVFDNNRDGTGTGAVLGSSRIVAIDPATKQTEIRYGGKGKTFFYSERRGKHQRLPNGHLLIVEAEAGRVFQVDRGGQIIWEYINQYSDTENARITDAGVFNKTYFKVNNWQCVDSQED